MTLDRLKIALRTMLYPEAWTLPPRLLKSMRASLRELRPVRSPVGDVLHPYAPPIGGKGYRRYLQGLKRLAGGGRTLFTAHLSVTDACRNSCARCSNLSFARADPPLADIQRLLSDLRRAGVSLICLTGGEPMLREDLPAIIASCGEDISVMLFSAGHKLDSRAAGELRCGGLEMAYISLDHYRRSEHDRIRGRDGAFKEAVQAIEACLAAGLYTGAQAVVEPALATASEMNRYLEFCKKLGVHDVMLLEPVPVRAADSCEALSPAQQRLLAELQTRSVRDPALPKVTSMTRMESAECLGCQAGFSFIYISAGGEVFPCDLAPLSFGNAYGEELGAILARLTERFPCPDDQCLALRINDRMGFAAPRPFSWEMLPRLDSGDSAAVPPKMMDWLPPAATRQKAKIPMDL
ncbi:MAG: radical SAM protein [Candidatus Sumerlaeota bacterium]|nr:radical SAM protein [Candidatus Sumerlaeota bacterium]